MMLLTMTSSFLKYIKLPEGLFQTFDEGYNNYSQFAAFSKARIFFIIRQKDNAVYKSIREKLLTREFRTRAADLNFKYF